jgi:hypothetical protein
MEYSVKFGPVVADAQIVDLPTAKLNSKIEFAEEDTLLQLFVDAAAFEMERYVGAPILERAGVEFTLAKYEHFKFPFPVSQILEIKYLDLDYTTQTVNAANYLLNNNQLIFKNDAPAFLPGSLIVKVKAGYTNAEMPADIKRAALLIFGAAEIYRENMPVKMETTAKALLRPFKIYG